MKVLGEFTTKSGVDALRSLRDRIDRLAQVPSLSEVRSAPGQSVRAMFSPATPFGQMPITVHIIPMETNGQDVRLDVHGRRGPHTLDVEIALTFASLVSGTHVKWLADIAVRGPAASVGQRVATDIAQRAIGEVLAAAADLATPES